ncbi:MAG: SBBP repeat-containing protein, partial [Bacteroidales bacterium]
LAKYDTSGNVLWAKSAGGIFNDEACSVAVDASGNIYVAGLFSSPTLTFDSTTLTNVGNNDILLVKYDTSGNVLWAKSAGGSSSDFANSVAVDTSGNTYVAGLFFSSTLSFGSTTLTNAGGIDIFLAKYDANGNVLWAKSAGGVDYDDAYSVAADASGNIYVAGVFSSPTLSFGSTTLTNAGGYDIFLTKYDAGGNVLWAKSAGGTGNDLAYSVAVDTSGNIYVAGYFRSPTIAFGITTLTNAGSRDIFLAKYDAAGNVFWAKSAGGTDYDEANSVAVNASGNIYVAGVFRSPTITFGSTTLTNASLDDIFLAKLGSDTITKINELSNSLNISVFPNPATNNIIIESPHQAVIEISNIQGQLIKTLAANSNKTSVDVSAFPSGMYFVKVKAEKGIAVKKFVKE